MKHLVCVNDLPIVIIIIVLRLLGMSVLNIH